MARHSSTTSLKVGRSEYCTQSAALMKWHLKGKWLDPHRIPQFGLIAEEVEKVDSRLVGRDDQGRVNTVRYEAVNAMLLNEFLKEHRKVQEQQ